MLVSGCKTLHVYGRCSSLNSEEVFYIFSFPHPSSVLCNAEEALSHSSVAKARLAAISVLLFDCFLFFVYANTSQCSLDVTRGEEISTQ